MMKLFLLILYVLLNILQTLCEEQYCPNSWIHRSDINTCIKVLTQAHNWADARALCKSKGTTPKVKEAIDLVTIMNERMNTDFVGSGMVTAEDFYWIGLNDETTEGTFVWASGQLSVFSNWAENEPPVNESLNCVVYQNKEWFTDSCDSEYHAICVLPGAIQCQQSNGGCETACLPDVTGSGCICPQDTNKTSMENCIENACTTDNGGCQHVCTPSGQTGRICSCNSGYQVDINLDTACTDTNECDRTPRPCQHVCNNKPGSYECSCIEGYIPSGSICILSDPCSRNNGGCTTHHTCLNVVQGFRRCECNKGHNHSSGTLCEDINECRQNNGGCAEKCKNTHGSFECICKANLVPIGDECRHQNPCKVNHGGCEHQCEMGAEVGTRDCWCRPGWKVEETKCIDTNECNDNNGGCAQVCTNMIGSYKCGCVVSYHLVGEKECVENTANLLIVFVTILAVALAAGVALYAKMLGNKIIKKNKGGHRRKHGLKTAHEEQNAEGEGNEEKKEVTGEESAEEIKRKSVKKDKKKTSTAPNDDEEEEDEEDEEEEEDEDDDEDEDDEEDD